jgi:hypothetical protein
VAFKVSRYRLVQKNPVEKPSTNPETPITVTPIDFINIIIAMTTVERIIPKAYR